MTRREEALLVWTKSALFCLAPFLAFYAHNLDRFVSLATILRHGAASGAFMLAVLAAARTLLPLERVRRLSDAGAIAWLCVFQYLLIKNALAAVAPSAVERGAQFALWGLLSAAAVATAWRASSSINASRILLASGAALVLAPSAQIALHALRARHAAATPGDFAQTAHPVVRRPNVYLIVPDGYAGSDSLKKYFGHDNSEFIRGLRRRGFFVPDHSYANFPVTFLSVPTTLQMDYVLQPGPKRFAGHEAFERILRGNNVFVDFAKRAGYTYVHYQDNMWAASECDDNIADVCIDVSERLRLNETTTSLLELTPFSGAFSRAVDRFNALAAHDKAVNSGVSSLLSWKRDRVRLPPPPYFVFAHVISPHGPYVYDENCASVPVAVRRSPGMADRLYVNQLRCVNRELLSLVDEILAQDEDPIIVLQSDHGTSSRMQFTRPFDRWDREDVIERFGNLNAIHLSARCQNSRNRPLSPVNNLRAVVACLTDQPPVFLPDKLYFATYKEYPEHGKIVEARRPTHP